MKKIEIGHGSGGATAAQVSDPAAPKVVTTKNYLGDPALPEDHIWQTWLKDVDEIDSFIAGYRGITSTFGCANGGLVGQGNRMLALSNTFLYCLGDPAQAYNGPKAKTP